jgi:hypothetical protein
LHFAASRIRATSPLQTKMSSSASWFGLELDGSSKLAKGPAEGKLVSALSWGHQSETDDSRRKTLDEDNAAQLSDGIIEHEDRIVQQTAVDVSSASRSLNVENAAKPGAVYCHPRGWTGSLNGSLSSSSSSSSLESLEAPLNEVANVTVPLEGFLDPPSPTVKAIPVDQSQLRCRRSFLSRFVDASNSSNLVYKQYSESELEDCQENNVHTKGNDAASSTSRTALIESLAASLDGNSPPGCGPQGALTAHDSIGVEGATSQATVEEPSKKLPLALSVRGRSSDHSPTAACDIYHAPNAISPTPESYSPLVLPPFTDEAILVTTEASTIVALPVDPIDIVPERQLILVRQGRRSRHRYLWRVIVQCGGLCMVLFLLGGICFAIACAISQSKCLALWRSTTARPPT